LTPTPTDTVTSSPTPTASLTVTITPTVTNTATSTPTSSVCVENTNDSGYNSLREKIQNAASGATICFNSSLSGQTITLASTLTIDKDITMDGSVLALPVTISGNNTVSVFIVNPGVTVTIKGLAVKDGNPTYYSGGSYYGGGVVNSGSLTITNCLFGSGSDIYNNGMLTIISSTLSDQGKSIYNNGTLTITGSTFSRNSLGIDNKATMTVTNSIFSNNLSGIHNGGPAQVTNSIFSDNWAGRSIGGGIYNYNTLTVTGSTFSNNMADGGGGIYNIGTLNVKTSTFLNNWADSMFGGNGGGIYNSGMLDISNSTFSGNSASGGYPSNGTYSSGGGIYNYDGGIYKYGGTVTVTNSTFSNNSASSGGGIKNTVILNIKNNIFANNSGGDCIGSAATALNNLIKDTGNYACNIANGVNGNIIGADPKLSPLANNGGSTQTFALLVGSPAINKGNDAICTSVGGKDQRGITRPQGAHCDIGSFELGQTATITSAGVYDGWVLESSENGNIGGTFNSTATTINVGDDALKKQYRGILSFNTASLPDNAVITAVTLQVKRAGIVGGGNPVTMFQGFIVDIKNGFFGTATLQTSDFQKAASQSSGPFILAPVGGWYSINLTNAKAYVNKLATNSGLTQIRLRFKLDDNNNAIANYISLYSGNAPAGNLPKLMITYYLP
jgi:hypothetical protein